MGEKIRYNLFLLSQFVLFFLLFLTNSQRNNIAYQICLLLKESWMLECLCCNLGNGLTDKIVLGRH